MPGSASDSRPRLGRRFASARRLLHTHLMPERLVADSKKKRVRPARKIVPRGKMGVAWVVGSVVIAAVILVAGIAFLIIKPQ